MMNEYKLDQYEYSFAKKIVDDYNKLPVFATPFSLINSALNGGVSEQSVIVLTGETGLGKSTLAMDFMVNFWIRYHDYVTFIYSGELSPAVVIEEVYKRTGLEKPVLDNIYGRFYGSIKDIESSLNKFKPKFILIDNLMCLACGVGDINQLQNNAIDKCREWAIKYNAIVLLVAHANKNSRDNNGKITINSICGSSNVANQATLVLALNKKDDNYRTLEILKNRKTGKLIEILLEYDVKYHAYKQVVGGEI